MPPINNDMIQKGIAAFSKFMGEMHESNTNQSQKQSRAKGGLAHIRKSTMKKASAPQVVQSKADEILKILPQLNRDQLITFLTDKDSMFDSEDRPTQLLRSTHIWPDHTRFTQR